MNFLNIAKQVNELVGTQGEVLSVTSPVGYQSKIINYINLAYTTIQDARKDWNFMKKSVTITTVSGTQEYSVLDASVIPDLDFGRWIHDSFLYQRAKLTEKSWEEWRRTDTANIIGQPSIYTTDVATNNVFFNMPNGAYEVDAEYYRTTHTLVNNTDIPILPPSFHYILVIKAVALVAGYMEYASMENRFEKMYNQMYGQLMRVSVPHRKLKPRNFIEG